MMDTIIDFASAISAVIAAVGIILTFYQLRKQNKLKLFEMRLEA